MPQMPNPRSFFPSFQKFWRGRSALEIFKFSLCILLPFGGGIVYADPKIMADLIRKLNYVEYPVAGPAPPVGEEINDYRKKFEDFKKQRKVEPSN